MGEIRRSFVITVKACRFPLRKRVPMNEQTTAFAKLVEEQHGPLVLYARQWIRAEAEDIVQEAFLRLLCDQSKQAIDNPTPWLFRVVRNEAITRQRRQALLGRHIDALRSRRHWFEAAPKQAWEDEEIAERIAEMPLELREVLVSKLWGGLSFQEIGELTGTSQSTSHRRYLEALQYLKEKLKATC